MNKNLDKNFHKYLFKYLHENLNKNLNYISTKKMDAKENKTDETPASLQLGLVEAQQVTLTDNNKIKQNKDPGHVTAEKNLPNTTAE